MSEYTCRPRLDILYVLMGFPIASEQFVIREIRTLASLGAKVRIITIGAPRDEETPDELSVRSRPAMWSPALWAGAVLAGLADPRATARLLRSACALRAEERGWRQLRLLKWALVALYFARRIRHHRPAVIHAHFANAPTTIALLLSSWLDLPFGFSAHARDLYAEHVDFSTKVAGASHVLACSERSTKDLRERLPAELQDRVLTVRHGVDLGVWNRIQSRPQQRPLILGVGRFEPKKGFSYLIEACAILRDAGVEFDCELIGGGSQAEMLRRLIASRRLTDRVRILPWLEPGALRHHYSRGSALAVPSVPAADGDRDNIPNVLIEALAIGLPVVAFPTPAVRQVLEGSCSECLVPQDAEALASRLQRICSDQAFSNQLRKDGRRLAEDLFDLYSNVRRFHEIVATRPIRPAGSP